MRTSAILVVLAIVWAIPAAAGSGDDFSNNLFSDLAPLLSLFGEQFAKQFMSESMGWLDNIIFAMAPLGILTAIVAAIRVGGPSWLKAVVGRARENRAAVEVELMSSTSHEVCELWNGQGIVRTMGRPEIQHIVYIENCEEEGTFGLYTVEGAENAGLLKGKEYDEPMTTIFREMLAIARRNGMNAADSVKNLVGRTPRKPLSRDLPASNIDLENNPQTCDPAHDSARSLDSNESRVPAGSGQTKSDTQNSSPNHNTNQDGISAPNISLNLHGGSKSMELFAVALFGILLQSGMLVFCGFSVYHPNFKQRFSKDGSLVRQYAFPTMATGTAILTIGMLICSAIVEKSTVEKDYLLTEESQNSTKTNVPISTAKCQKKVRSLWLQKTHTVSDQAFDSFVLFGKDSDGRDRILTSRRNDTLSQTLTNQSSSTNNTSGSGAGKPTHSKFSNLLPAWVKKVAANKTEASTLLGVFLGLSGFVLQFEGLRGMNWSASIAQLVCVVLMTVLRALVRRGMIINPDPGRLHEHHELDWLALRVAKTRGDFWPSESNPLKNDPKDHELTNRLTWEPLTNGRAWVGYWNDELPEHTPSCSDLDSKDAQYTLHIRRRLGMLANWTGPISTLAVAVADSIEAVMNTLFDDRKSEYTKFTWLLSMNIQGSQHEGSRDAEIYFKIEKQDGRWKMDATYIEAALSLWLFHKTQDSDERKESEDWLRKDKSLKRKIYRLLGSNKSKGLQKDMNWWIGDVIYQRFPPKRNDPSGVQQVSEVDCIGFADLKIADGEDGDRDRDGDDGDENEEISSNPRILGDFLVVSSDLSLESSLAQHIFSSFIWAVAEKIPDDKLNGTNQTSIARGDLFRTTQPETLLSLRLESKELARIANDIQRTGLADLHETYLCLIPPLCRFQKLSVDVVVEFVRQQTRDLEILGSWEVLVPVYRRLFEETRTLGIKNSVFQKVAALLINLLFSVKETLKLREELRIDNVQQLKTQRKDISDELKSDDSLRTLMDHFAILCLFQSGPRQELWQELTLHKPSTDSADTAYTFFGNHVIFSKVMRGANWELKRLPSTDFEKMDIFGMTPLHYAATQGSVEIVQTVLEKIPDPNVTDLNQWTPLRIAIENADQNKRESIMQALLQKGADTEIRGRDGIGPLHCAARCSGKATEIMLQAGANITSQDSSRKTPLHWAAYAGCVDAIDTLLAKGADEGARDDYGRTPLHLAAVIGKYEAIDKLLEHRKTEKVSKDRDGRTSLHLAAIQGHEKAIKVLLGDVPNCCEETDIEDTFSWTPLDVANIMYGQENCSMLLLDACNKKRIKSFNIAAIFGRESSVRLLAQEFEKYQFQEILKYTNRLMARWDNFYDVLVRLYYLDYNDYLDFLAKRREEPNYYKELEAVESFLNQEIANREKANREKAELLESDGKTNLKQEITNRENAEHLKSDGKTNDNTHDGRNEGGESEGSESEREENKGGEIADAGDSGEDQKAYDS